MSFYPHPTQNPNLPLDVWFCILPYENENKKKIGPVYVVYKDDLNIKRIEYILLDFQGNFWNYPKRGKHPQCFLPARFSIIKLSEEQVSPLCPQTTNIEKLKQSILAEKKENQEELFTVFSKMSLENQVTDAIRDYNMRPGLWFSFHSEELLPEVLKQSFYLLYRNDGYSGESAHCLLLDTQGELWNYCLSNNTISKHGNLSESYNIPAIHILRKIDQKESKENGKKINTSIMNYESNQQYLSEIVRISREKMPQMQEDGELPLFPIKA